MYTAWMNSPLPLGDVVAADEAGLSQEGIQDAFGDSYLCSFNPLFRAIRKKCIGDGVSFSSVPDQFHNAYSILPLLMVQDIIDRGVIPFFGNATVIRGTLDRSPNLIVPPSFLLMSLRRNHLLHESAHCVAFKTLAPLFWTAGSDKNRWYVLTCLLCEAYANSVERIAAFAANSDLHRLFFFLNSYVDDVVGGQRALHQCLQVLGLEALLRLSMLVFLRMNRRAPWSSADIKTLVAGSCSGSSDHSTRLIMELLAERFSGSLNANFVNVTTPVFFQYMTCEQAYMDVCGGEFILQVCNQQAFANRLDELINLTCEGFPKAIADLGP